MFVDNLEDVGCILGILVIFGIHDPIGFVVFQYIFNPIRVSMIVIEARQHETHYVLIAEKRPQLLLNCLSVLVGPARIYDHGFSAMANAD